MLPFKDPVPRERPPLLSAALAALGLGLWLAGLLGGGLLSLLLCVLALAIFGQSVEDVLGHLRFALLCMLGGAFAFGVELLAGRGASTSLALGAAGIAAAVLGAYLALRPRARILTLVLVPLLAGAIELPAVALIGAWLLAQILIGALALDEPLGGGPSWLPHLLALPLALIALRSLAGPPRPSAGEPPESLAA
ncbi:MAG: rhomboid family intramembrane serine protease [Solirubrobacteraceae bacterium]